MATIDLPNKLMAAAKKTKTNGGFMSQSASYGNRPSRIPCPIMMKVLSSQSNVAGKKKGKRKKKVQIKSNVTTKTSLHTVERMRGSLGAIDCSPPARSLNA